MKREPIKPSQVSAYNHKSIGTVEKPLISNADFAFLFTQVESGNHKPYYEADKKYSFENKQRKMILDIIENRIL